MQEIANAMSSHYLNYMYEGDKTRERDSHQSHFSRPSSDTNLLSGPKTAEDNFLYKKFAKKAMAMGKKAASIRTVCSNRAAPKRTKTARTKT